MRSFPIDNEELKDLEKLKAEDWMIELLKKNPNYVYWGNNEDYMWNDNEGWSSRVELESVDELFELDEYNELVNFYFEVYRESKKCTSCHGSGYNKATKELSDTWYSFKVGEKAWQYKLTQDEVDALWKEDRLHSFKDKPTPEEVNEWAKKHFGHDSINQYICVKARAEKLGVYGLCEECNGEGYIYTEPKAKVGLQMWILHPRKGASRGVYLKNIEEHEVPRIIEYLKEARDRNNERFSKL